MTDLNRPHYSESVVEPSGKFTDPMNKFLDELIEEVDSLPFGDVTIKCGDRISGDGLIQFGSRV